MGNWMQIMQDNAVHIGQIPEHDGKLDACEHSAPWADTKTPARWET